MATTTPFPPLEVLPSPRAKNVLPRSAIPAGDCLCDHCIGKCCRYFSLPIRRPETWDGFAEVRRYLAHERTMVYVEGGTWYLLVLARCHYLTDEDRCRVYHDRPKVCREYTADECEYDDDWIFERVFETAEQVWEYAEATLATRPAPRARPAPADGHLADQPSRGFSLPIREPKTWDDFDEVRWYLAHERTMIYVEEGTWHLLVLVALRSATPEGGRSIPGGSSGDEPEPREDQGERVFETAEQVWEYAEAVLRPRRPRRARPAIAVIADAPPGAAPPAP